MHTKAHAKVDALRGMPAFSNVNDRNLAKLAALADEVSVEPGTVLAYEGAVAREAYLVLTGTASVAVTGEVVEVVGPGEFLGEMALLDRSVRSATMTALEPMTLLVFSITAFRSLMDAGWAAQRVARQLAERVRRLEHPASAG